VGESLVLERRSGPVELIRPDGKVGILRQPGQPNRRVPLTSPPVRDRLAEELRRPDPDEIYQAILQALTEVHGWAGARQCGTNGKSQKSAHNVV
jgi:hypothetical protein